MINFLFFTLLFLTACQHTATSPAATTQSAPSLAPSENITCSLQKDVRRLRILPVQDKGCSLQYTKYNTEKSIATSQSSKQHCVDISKRIITQLTQSGFSCE